jgi:4a-hydroxytetrahydrobiopterin dehydratase
MKPFSASPGISRVKARNAALLNLFATPGMGSLLARRWLAGAGQLLLSLAGFVLIIVWFASEMRQFYGQINGDVAVQPIGWILTAGAALFVSAWFWSLVTSLSLVREASSLAVDSLKLFQASLSKLDEPQIGSALAALPGWRRQGDLISRTYEFKDFPAAMKFVNAVAAMAEQVQHHPDIDVRWNKVTLALTTHDAGGLTGKDFTLARECDLRATGKGG